MDRRCHSGWTHFSSRHSSSVMMVVVAVVLLVSTLVTCNYHFRKSIPGMAMSTVATSVPQLQLSLPQTWPCHTMSATQNLHPDDRSSEISSTQDTVDVVDIVDVDTVDPPGKIAISAQFQNSSPNLSRLQQLFSFGFCRVGQSGGGPFGKRDWAYQLSSFQNTTSNQHDPKIDVVGTVCFLSPQHFKTFVPHLLP